MKLKAFLPLIAVFFFGFTQHTQAQYYFYNEDYYDDPVLFEGGGSLGIMNCLTDVGGNKGIGKNTLKDLNVGNTKFATSLYLNATYQMKLGVRLEFTYGTVGGYDSILAKDVPNTSGRYERNLSFRTHISEVTLIGEIYPTYLFRTFDSDKEPPRAAPYLMIGVGIFHFNPQAKDHTGQWVDLQPLHTEGEGFPEYPNHPTYALTQMNIPFGLGLRYEAAPKINIRAEILYRKLKTDYLDDVSTTYVDPTVFSKYLTGANLNEAIELNKRSGPTWQYAKPGDIRGNPNNNDSYFTFNIKIGFILNRKRLQ